MVAKLMLLSILYLAGLTWEQSIEWVDPYRIYGMYYQPGLIQKRDAIILYGEIDLGQTAGFDRVHYEIKKHNMAYSTLCYLYLTKCEGFKNSFCYCKSTSNAHVFEVVVNITADTSLSEAKVKGAMEIYDKKINSVEKSIPKIYDVTNIQVNMYVNGMIGNASSCHMEITGNDVCIAIEIPDIVNLQYQLVLKNVRTNMILRNESKSVFYSTQVMDTLQLAVYFQVYDLPYSKQHFQCFIQAKSPDVYKRRPEDKNTPRHSVHYINNVKKLSERVAHIFFIKYCIQRYEEKLHNPFTDEKDKSNPFSVLFGFTLAVLVIFILLILVSILFRKRILSYIESKKTKKPLRQSHKDEGTTVYGNSQNPEELFSLVTLQGQNEENADDMTCSKGTVSDEENLLIPDNIIAKIKEVKKMKENKKIPVIGWVIERVSRPFTSTLHDSLVDFAKCQLETMVSVDVEVVSNRRPKTWPGSKVPYPLNNNEKWKRHGYGRVINVSKFNKDNSKRDHVRRTYLSTQLSKHDGGSLEWVEVLVYISRHLVFDDYEAKHTTCKFIMNKGLPKTLQLHGAIVRFANVGENWTLLSFFSKDVSIYDNLQENLNIFNQNWKALDICNVISFIVYCRDMTMKKTKFADLFDMFREDKTLSFCLNTYSEKQNLAIFFERARASLMRMYQKKADIHTFDEDLDLIQSNGDIKLELSSMPFIIKNVQKKKKDKSTNPEEIGKWHAG